MYKRTRPISSFLDQTSLVNKWRFIWPKREIFSRGTNTGNPKWGRCSLQCRRFLLRSNLLPKVLCWNFPRRGGDGASHYFYSPQSSTVIKSKLAATTILRTRTRFRPPKIRLHCRLGTMGHSRSQSEHRICFILPACGFRHITKLNIGHARFSLTDLKFIPDQSSHLDLLLGQITTLHAVILLF